MQAATLPRTLPRGLKPDVSDLHSITGHHLIHAGTQGIIHLTFIINSIITNITLVISYNFSDINFYKKWFKYNFKLI